MKVFSGLRLRQGAGGSNEYERITFRSTEGTREIEHILREPQTYGDAVLQVAQRFDVDVQRAGELIDRLLAAGAVVDDSNLHPIELGSEKVVELVRAMAPERGTALNAVIEACDALANVAIEEREPAIQRARDLQAEAFFAPPGLKIDATRRLSGTLAHHVLDDVGAMVAIMLRNPGVNLVAYKERFRERYGDRRREIPLLQLIDDTVGIGVPDGMDAVDPRRVFKRANALAALSMEALRDRRHVVVLDKSELEGLIDHPFEQSRVTDSLEIGFEIIAESNEAIDHGNYSICPGTFVASPGAGRSAARFFRALGSDATQRLRDLESELVRPSCIRAEIAASPPFARTLNLLARPRVAASEIAVDLLGVSPDSMYIDELSIGLDGDRFYVVSQASGGIVEPIESHLVTHEMQSPALRLLSLISKDKTTFPLGFTWDEAAHVPFIPQIRFGRLILSRARWRFDKRAATLIFEDSERRREWMLPRFVYLCDSDNELLIDLERPAGRQLLADEIARSKRDFVHLVEALPLPEHCWLRDEEGNRYRAELIVSAVRSNPRGHTQSLPIEKPNERCSFGPGSPWLTYRIAMSHADAAAEGLQLAADLLTDPLVVEHSRFRFFQYRNTRDSHIALTLEAVSLPGRLDIERTISQRIGSLYNDGLAGSVAIVSSELEHLTYAQKDSRDACHAILTDGTEEAAAIMRETRLTDSLRVRFALARLIKIVISAQAVFGDLPFFNSKPLALNAEHRALVASMKRDLQRDSWPVDERVCTTLAPLAHTFAQEQLSSIVGDLLDFECSRWALTAEETRRAFAMLWQCTPHPKRR